MRGLQAKLTIILVSFLLVHALAASVISSTLYETAVSDSILTEARQKLSQINVNLDNLINSAAAAGNLLGKDPELLNLLEKSSSQTFPGITRSDNPSFPSWYLKLTYPIMKKLNAVQYSMLYQFDASVYLIDENGIYYAPTSAGCIDVEQDPFIRETEERKGYIVYHTPSTDLDLFRSVNSRSLVISQAVRKNYSNKIIGTLLISMEFPDALASAFDISENSDGKILVLLDEKLRIAVGGEEMTAGIDWGAFDFHSDSLLSVQLDGVPYSLIFNRNYRTGWMLVQLIPQNTLFSQVKTLRNLNLAVLFVLIAVEILLCFFMLRHALRPLRQLSQLMTRVGEGEFDLSAPIQGNDEVAQISASFNTMVRRVDQLITNNKVQYQLREQAMLETLRSQINPHFLLNTLNDIKWLAILNQDQDVASALSKLGSLLETSLGRNSTFVTLNEEIRYVAKYVDLANLRFNNQLTIEFDIAPDTGGLFIPVLILQPLIENVAQHGLREDKKTEIRILSRIEDQMLILEMVDNGNGMPPEKLKEIRDELNDFENVPRKRIGVNNVHKRIVLTYGLPYGLSIDSEPGKGTQITLRFPIQQERRMDLTLC